MKITRHQKSSKHEIHAQPTIVESNVKRERKIHSWNTARPLNAQNTKSRFQNIDHFIKNEQRL